MSTKSYREILKDFPYRVRKSLEDKVSEEINHARIVSASLGTIFGMILLQVAHQILR